jgi:hypothetical protein
MQGKTAANPAVYRAGCWNDPPHERGWCNRDCEDEGRERCRTLAANLVTAAFGCLSHELGYRSCGCDQGTPSDAWQPNVLGRVPSQLCPHERWTRKARRPWNEDPAELECDTCGSRRPATTEIIGKALVARCPACHGWTMFHGRPDSDTALEWAEQCRLLGDSVEREEVRESPGRSCEESDYRAAHRTCHLAREGAAEEQP